MIMIFRKMPAESGYERGSRTFCDVQTDDKRRCWRMVHSIDLGVVDRCRVS